MTNTQDQAEIIQVINRYGVAMDARRWDLFDTIFTAEAELDYSWSRWNSLDVFKAEFAQAHAGFDATQHAMFNHLVEAEGNNASAFTYCSWRLIKLGTKGGDHLFGTAWYDDTLIRTADGWRIACRRCRILWSEGNPAAIGADAPAGWDQLRDEAAQRDVNYLQAFDGRQSRVERVHNGR